MKTPNTVNPAKKKQTFTTNVWMSTQRNFNIVSLICAFCPHKSSKNDKQGRNRNNSCSPRSWFCWKMVSINNSELKISCVTWPSYLSWFYKRSVWCPRWDWPERRESHCLLIHSIPSASGCDKHSWYIIVYVAPHSSPHQGVLASAAIFCCL